tara:strand:+ start:77 stop:538 length:462 start_codon:yes stop_codon:yes gene_type:complete
MIWNNAAGKEFTLKTIIEIIEKFPNSQIHIGTDSHYKSGKLIFATVIAVYDPGRCSRYFFQRRFENKIFNDRKNLSVRLLQEVQSSIETATTVRELISNKHDISVHADISENTKNGSSVVSEPAKNWIQGMGFECKMKPLAWASSSIADLHAK